MNDFLVQAFMDAAAKEPAGERINFLVRAVADHCALIAQEHSGIAAEQIRQQFVYATPTATALASKLSLAAPKEA